MHLIFLRDAPRLHAQFSRTEKRVRAARKNNRATKRAAMSKQKQPVNRTAADPAYRNGITGQPLSY
jgi:hypothetical protein